MSQKPLILVCDDSRNIANSIVIMLQNAGYRATAVGNALEAVGAARRERPALLLMDIMMPGMDGAMASDLMRDSAELASIPIVLISAMMEDEVKAKAEEAGVAGWLTKPFRKDDLLAAVGRCAREQVALAG